MTVVLFRGHMALKFGREIRTPEMQAGFTTRRLTFREILASMLIIIAERGVRRLAQAGT